MFESYEVGAACWIPSKSYGWVSAIITAKRVVSATEVEVDLKVDSHWENEKSPVTKKLTADPSPDVPLRNPPALETTSDLVTLSYLNEPSVLHAIRQRYAQLNIYTFSGIVLIATNPFARVDNLYTNEVVQTYSGRQRDELEPHLYSIAEDAFKCMQRDHKNQTIVVSGESGAGKTMSAKYIMRYFATVEDPSKSRHSGSGSSSSSFALSVVEREILATNPIMEAFGNAKTTRNDNSSRFGKYLEIRFDKGWDISGARIRTYLLERSRIVYQPATERNYHIFYQFMKGLHPSVLSSLGLDAGISAFSYINRGDPDISGVDDVQEFRETCEALRIVGVDDNQQMDIYKLLGALLHLGNIELKATSTSVLVNPEDPSLLHAARLLAISSSELAKWLTKRQIKVRTEISESSMDIKSATVVRDSISKYIYSSLFEWLLIAINSKLFNGNSDDLFIGVLDIYGFEHFQHNSFEQFCINYANEKLQQEFNQHVFKLEQEEYNAEEIDWKYIDFVDNQPCITLIESNIGILGLLDDESRVPSGNDEGFTHKLYGTLDGKPNFHKPRLGESSFIVSHYAHDVEYETAGFIEKNRDTVPDTIINLLQTSKNSFLIEVLQSQSKSDPDTTESKLAVTNKRPGITRRPTLGNIFKLSLIELMNTISSTNAHYIRCIKPNEEKQAWLFDGPMVLSQLRACGVLETIRISSQGFPGRYFYEDFASRYELLLHSSQRKKAKSAQELTLAILEEFRDPTEDKCRVYALGKTKVFSRAGMLARLENRRTKRQQEAAISLQRQVKMRYARSYLQTTLAFVKRVQTAIRGKLARERARLAYAQFVATTIQALARRYMACRRLDIMVTTVVSIQAVVRGNQARVRALEENKNRVAVAMQALIRTKLIRKSHVRIIKSFKTVQSMVRRRSAIAQLQQLKEKQHSVKHFEEVQYRMENKVVELQNTLSKKREDHKAVLAELASVQTAYNLLNDQLNSLRKEHSKAIESADENQRNLTSQLDQQRTDAEELRSELETRSAQTKELQDTLAEQEQQVQKLTYENSELKRMNADLEHRLHIAQTINVSTGGAMVYHNSRQQYNEEMNGEAYFNGGVEPNYNDIKSLNPEEQNNEVMKTNLAIEEMLKSTNGIKEELLTNLIRSLKIPYSVPDCELPARDILFPANITNLLVSEMWRFGFIEDSERLLSVVLRTIQDTVTKCVSNGDIILSAAPFWISNVHEIYSFMTLVEHNLMGESLQNAMPGEELHQYSTLTDLAKQDLKSVIFNIYYVYMKFIKKTLEKIIVPAVVEDQNIPGFRTVASHSIFSNFFSSSQPFTMDDLILFLNKILMPLQGYYLEDFYIRQPLKEIMTMIGIKSFNDMIMRRNFLSWRRAVQINYNITRVAEWCKSYKFDECISPLEAISQATKLLQLKKNWDDEIGILYDIFWGLNPTQIHRLMSNYHPVEYETPVNPRTLEIVAQKIKESVNVSTEIAFPVRPTNDSGPFEIAAPRELDRLEPYVPAYIQVPHIREFAALSTTVSILMEQANQLDYEAQFTENGDIENLPKARPESRDAGNTNHGTSATTQHAMHTNNPLPSTESSRIE